ncbi:hypothetical protein V6N12_010075 [Hibiscus sabdariffa]|uniref:Uncharacterized protein n=1 Tax=Hibiscus sabdariffa TaxID=183260 RepID=A0ABR2ECM1_9ROSI
MHEKKLVVYVALGWMYLISMYVHFEPRSTCSGAPYQYTGLRTGVSAATQTCVETCVDKAERASSRDVVASLERRVDRLEESMRDVHETHEANIANQRSNADGGEMEAIRK